jgi:CheY-like chemotaxis protein
MVSVSSFFLSAGPDSSAKERSMSTPRPQPVESAVPSVVVVDPRFDAYKSLAASARLGKITLHFRSSGAEALQLARRLRVDAWLIAPELDDISGHDLVPLLQSQLAAKGHGDTKVAVVAEPAAGGSLRSQAESDAHAAGADSLLSRPITFQDLEDLLGRPAVERAQASLPAHSAQSLLTLPVGVGAAAIAIVLLIMG